MKRISKLTVAVLLLLSLVMQFGPGVSAIDQGGTTPTGYTCAEDVEYVIVSGTVVNWGAREEDCTFLSTYAQNYYTGSYTWSVLSAKDGGTGTTDAYTSDLYEALQKMMKSKHTNIQGYQATREYYQYTDCVRNDYSLLSSFYSGKMVQSQWDGGKTYNREHIWPRSKCIDQSKANDSADIMLLRPTIPSENGSRGNKAYGESSGYQNVDASVRGDCARMVLYGYVRWGNTSYMWGTGGVIENLDILLKWMEEDPVDTWEMGRNDAVQSITGVRNVFVDYPEFAWMIFGQQVPEGMTTPSGQGSDAPACSHDDTERRNQKDATCGNSGYTGDVYCKQCGEKISSGSKISATGNHSFGDWVVTKEPTETITGTKVRTCKVCDREESAQIPKLEAPACTHDHTELREQKDATCGADGYSGDTYCTDCGLLIGSGEVMAATGNHSFGDWTVEKEATATETGLRTRHCDTCGLTEAEEIPVCQHPTIEVRDAVEAGCNTTGYSGDTYCPYCETLLEKGEVVRATKKHTFGEWVSTKEGDVRTCTSCGHKETVAKEVEVAPEKDNTIVWIIIAAVGAGAVIGAVVVIVVIKKRKAKMD